MIIRNANFNDLETIKAMKHNLQDMHTKALPHIFQNKGDYPVLPTTLVCEKDNKIVGFISYCLLHICKQENMVNRKTMELESLYVDPEYRGLGVGRALLDKTKRIAKEEGCQTVELLVWNFNEKAINLYENADFKPICTKYQFQPN